MRYPNRRLWRQISKRPIDSTKNMVVLDATVATLTVTVLVLANAVKATLLDDTVATRVGEQCSIKNLYINMRLYNRNGNLPGQEKVIIFLRRNAGALLGAPTLAQCNAIGLQSWRNSVFQCQIAKPPGPDGLPMGLVSIRIPRRYHKMVIDDQWELVIANNSSGSIDVCGLCLYKWYT